MMLSCMSAVATLVMESAAADGSEHGSRQRKPRRNHHRKHSRNRQHGHHGRHGPLGAVHLFRDRDMAGMRLARLRGAWISIVRHGFSWRQHTLARLLKAIEYGALPVKAKRRTSSKLLLCAGPCFRSHLRFQGSSLIAAPFISASTGLPRRQTTLANSRRWQRVQYVVLSQPRPTKLQNPIANVTHVRRMVRICINDELHSFAWATRKRWSLRSRRSG